MSDSNNNNHNNRIFEDYDSSGNNQVDFIKHEDVLKEYGINEKPTRLLYDAINDVVQSLVLENHKVPSFTKSKIEKLAEIWIDNKEIFELLFMDIDL